MRDLKQSKNRCVIEGKSCSIHRKEVAKISEGFGMCNRVFGKLGSFRVSGHYTSSQ